MGMKQLLINILLLVSACAAAQDFSASLIPDSLKEEANAVKRLEEYRIVIVNPGKAVLKNKTVITVLNEKADRYAQLVVYYSKFREVNDIDGTLYDAAGKKLKTVKKKDILDFSGFSDGSLIDDSRLKIFSFNPPGYPYTVKFETEIELKGIFGFPAWMPVSDEHLGIQESRFIVECPADYNLRYKLRNFSTAPVVNKDGSTATYQWALQNIKAVTDESFTPDWDEIFPTVMVAPSDFEYGGYKGSMSSWQEMGKFIYTLHEGRNELPDAIKKDIHSLTDHITNEAEKINILFDYLQKNTRYISIQLGIGGLQPFKAVEVAQKKYGDCKALSNYMVSILNEAGIKAFPVIIKSGRGEKGLLEDFPSNQFDHEVVCVPGAKDTTWLECTSQTVSAGFMGGFTGNRKALLVNETGGHVVSTPRYGVNENQQLRKIDATIDANGHLLTSINTRFTGEQEEEVNRFIHVYTPEQKQNRLNQEISLPSYKVEESSYAEQKGKCPYIDEYLKISAPNYASITGKRLFIQPNLVNKLGGKLSTEKPRKFPMEFTYSYRDVDTIQIQIPEGYEPESIPKDISLQSAWGKYSITFKTNGNKITVLRISERYAGLYAANEYTAFAKYQEDIYKADRSKMVFVKKE